MSYPGFYCHPTTSYLVLSHPILSYRVLPILIQIVPPGRIAKLYPLEAGSLHGSIMTLVIISSHTLSHCILLPSYHILPRPTLDSIAIPILPYYTFSGIVGYAAILPCPTLSYILHVLFCCHHFFSSLFPVPVNPGQMIF